MKQGLKDDDKKHEAMIDYYIKTIIEANIQLSQI